MNNSKYYDATTSITEAKAPILVGGESTYTDIEIHNETDKDVILSFGNSDMLIKVGVKIQKSFLCKGTIEASLKSGDTSSTGNFFIQVTKGK